MGIIDSGKDVIIEKPTCFGEHVELNNKVKIKELSSIGTDVIIGEEVVIEKSVIWDNVKIGHGSYINESIICNDCEVGDNVILERAIIPPYCKISDNNQLRDITLELGQQI
jgi:NDP-sugar pyrophosphorylase family protein